MKFGEINEKFLFVMTLLLIANSVIADTRYFNGKIERIEVCKLNLGTISLFFKDISGYTPVVGNACSNDASYPTVQISTDASTLTEHDNMILSIALSAQVADRSVRVRYDDLTNLIISLAID